MQVVEQQYRISDVKPEVESELMANRSERNIPAVTHRLALISCLPPLPSQIRPINSNVLEISFSITDPKLPLGEHYTYHAL